MKTVRYEETTMTERDPIEISRTRRPMEAELTAAERQSRSDQVHSELEIREQLLAEQETHEQEAKAKKESAKEVEARIAQLDLRVKALSSAVRMGRETRQVDVLFVYDPTRGEVLEKRSDTDVEILARKPTSPEWDTIKSKMQQPIEATGDPCRAPAAIPGMDPELLAEVEEELEEGTTLTIQVLGHRMALREGDAFTVDDRRIDIMLSGAGDGQHAPELTKAERWAFTAGVKQAVAELARVDGDDGTPFGAPEPHPMDDDAFEEAKRQARALGAAHRPPFEAITTAALLDALGGPAVFDDVPQAQRDAVVAAYELGRGAAGPGETTIMADDEGEEPATCGAQHPTGPAVCGLAAPHGGLRRGAGEHGNVEWNGPLSEQVLQNIEGAREAREAAEALKPKRGRGRPKGSTTKKPAAE